MLLNPGPVSQATVRPRRRAHNPDPQNCEGTTKIRQLQPLRMSFLLHGVLSYFFKNASFFPIYLIVQYPPRVGPQCSMNPSLMRTLFTVLEETPRLTAEAAVGRALFSGSFLGSRPLTRLSRTLLRKLFLGSFSGSRPLLEVVGLYLGSAMPSGENLSKKSIYPYFYPAGVQNPMIFTPRPLKWPSRVKKGPICTPF